MELIWRLGQMLRGGADRFPPAIRPDPRWSWLAASWESRFPECRPVAYELRGYADRWVRFHSLPGSKRYAETDAERAEVLARHHAVLTALGARDGELLVVTTSANESRFPRRRDRRLAQAAPGATLWQSLIYEADEDFEIWWHLFASTVGTLEELDPLLRLAADDHATGVIIMQRDLTWLYHPYDGGADVIASSTEQRDALAKQFADWLSDRPDGL